jgi:hypothetical protein
MPPSPRYTIDHTTMRTFGELRGRSRNLARTRDLGMQVRAPASSGVFSMPVLTENQGRAPTAADGPTVDDAEMPEKAISRTKGPSWRSTGPALISTRAPDPSRSGAMVLACDPQAGSPKEAPEAC